MSTITVIGHVGSEPKLAFTQSGKAVLSFPVAETARVKKGDQWEDGATTWYRPSVWGAEAEALGDSLHKGSKVIVTGELVTHEFQGRDGEARSGLEIKFARAGIIPKASPKGNGATYRKPEADDPWAGDSSDVPF